MGKKVDNNLTSIYTVEGIDGKNAIRIKYIETSSRKMEENKLTDTMIDAYDITKRRYGSVSGFIYACNITHNYLNSSKKLPVLYIDVLWSRVGHSKLFYRLYLYFTIESDITNLASIDELLGTELYGKFSIEVSMDGINKSLGETIDVYPGNEKMKDILRSFTLTDDMKEMHLQLSQIEEDKIADKYRHEFEDYKEVPKPTISLKDLQK